MPQDVAVPGFGTIRFPDGMSPQAMEAALRNDPRVSHLILQERIRATASEQDTPESVIARNRAAQQQAEAAPHSAIDTISRPFTYASRLLGALAEPYIGSQSPEVRQRYGQMSLGERMANLPPGGFFETAFPEVPRVPQETGGVLGGLQQAAIGAADPVNIGLLLATGGAGALRGAVLRGAQEAAFAGDSVRAAQALQAARALGIGERAAAGGFGAQAGLGAAEELRNLREDPARHGTAALADLLFAGLGARGAFRGEPPIVLPERPAPYDFRVERGGRPGYAPGQFPGEAIPGPEPQGPPGPTPPGAAPEGAAREAQAPPAAGATFADVHNMTAQWTTVDSPVYREATDLYREAVSRFKRERSGTPQTYDDLLARATQLDDQARATQQATPQPPPETPDQSKSRRRQPSAPAPEPEPAAPVQPDVPVSPGARPDAGMREAVGEPGGLRSDAGPFAEPPPAGGGVPTPEPVGATADPIAAASDWAQRGLTLQRQLSPAQVIEMTRQGMTITPQSIAQHFGLSMPDARRVYSQAMDAVDAAEKVGRSQKEAARRRRQQTPVQSPESNIPAGNIAEGNRGVAYTPDNNPVPYHYAVVPLESLIPSHTDSFEPNPAYDQRLQPRERSRQASKEQVVSLAQKLNPERLGESATTSEGAPVVGADMMVESGNGRVLAIRRAKSEGYHQWVAQNAGRFGIDPATLQGVSNPVLVRVREGELQPEQRAALAEEMGRSPVAHMSPSEIARLDSARLLSSGMLRPDRAGRYPVPESREFQLRFMEGMGQEERAGMQTAEGALSKDGALRIQRAVLAAVVDDPTALERMLESRDDNTRNIGQGILRAAPALASVRQLAEEGEIFPVDLHEEIADAANMLSFVRGEGITLEDYLQNAALFDPPTAETAILASIFDRFARSGAKIGRILNYYAEIAVGAGNPSQPAMEDSAPPVKTEMLDAAVRMDGAQNETIDLFSEAPAPAGEPGVPSAREEANAPRGSTAGEGGAEGGTLDLPEEPGRGPGLPEGAAAGVRGKTGRGRLGGKRRQAGYVNIGVEPPTMKEIMAVFNRDNITAQAANELKEDLSTLHREHPVVWANSVAYGTSRRYSSIEWDQRGAHLKQAFDNADQESRFVNYMLASRLRNLARQLNTEYQNTQDAARRKEIVDQVKDLFRPIDTVTGQPITVAMQDAYFQEPGVQRAVQAYKDHVLPYLTERLVEYGHDPNGITTLPEHGGVYFPAVAVDEAGDPLSGTGTSGGFTKPKAKVSGPSAARAFSGTADMYDWNLDSLMLNRFFDGTRSANAVKMLQSGLRHGAWSVERSEPTDVAYRVEDRFGRKFTGLPDIIYAPQDMAKELEVLFDRNLTSAIEDAAHAIQTKFILAKLWGIGDMVFHGMSRAGITGLIRGKQSLSPQTATIKAWRDILANESTPEEKEAAARIMAKYGAMREGYLDVPSQAAYTPAGWYERTRYWLYGRNGIVTHCHELIYRFGKSQGWSELEIGERMQELGIAERFLQPRLQKQLNRLGLGFFFSAGATRMSAGFKYGLALKMLAGSLLLYAASQRSTDPEGKWWFERPGHRYGEYALHRNPDGTMVYLGLWNWLNTGQSVAMRPFASVQESVSKGADTQDTINQLAADTLNEVMRPATVGIGEFAPLATPYLPYWQATPGAGIELAKSPVSDTPMFSFDRWKYVATRFTPSTGILWGDPNEPYRMNKLQQDNDIWASRMLRTVGGPYMRVGPNPDSLPGVVTRREVQAEQKARRTAAMREAAGRR